jgi:hypothetical protein
VSTVRRVTEARTADGAFHLKCRDQPPTDALGTRRSTVGERFEKGVGPQYDVAQLSNGKEVLQQGVKEAGVADADLY